MCAYPNLKESLDRKEEWSEDRMVEWISSNIGVDPAVKGKVRDLYGQIEESPYTEDLLPHPLVPSTTLAGVSYPLAGPLGLGKSRLAATPTRYQDLVTLLNQECTPVLHACYMLFRTLRPGESTYFNKKCPVQHIFATSYEESAGYPRLTPRDVAGSATIANLRRDLKRVLRRVIDLLILPEGLALEEVDMVACHTGIYAGLMGPAKAPNTWEAYGSGAFWAFIFDKWGGLFNCPKALLKRILYSGLNGASLTSRQGAISACVREAYGNGVEADFDSYLKKVLAHPILQELAHFQTTVGSWSSVHLPTRLSPYYGKLEEELSRDRPHGSRYHDGLLTSRILASHEAVLLMYLAEYMEKTRIGVPLSFENDGLVLLTRPSAIDGTLAALDAFLRQVSLSFLGVEIPVERKL